jgi:hypothetical protein
MGLKVYRLLTYRLSFWENGRLCWLLRGRSSLLQQERMLGAGTVLGIEWRKVQVAAVQTEEGTHPSGGSVVLDMSVMELQYICSRIYLFILIMFPYL